MNAMNRVQRFARILSIGNSIALPISIVLFFLYHTFLVDDFGREANDFRERLTAFTIPFIIGTCLLIFYYRQWRELHRYAWLGWLFSTVYNAFAVVLWWLTIPMAFGLWALPIALWVTLTLILSALALTMGNPNVKVQYKVEHRNLRRQVARALLFCILAFLMYMIISNAITYYSYLNFFAQLLRSIGDVAAIFMKELGILLSITILLHLREWFKPSARFALLHWFVVALLHGGLAYQWLKGGYTPVLGLLCSVMAVLALIPLGALLFQGVRRKPQKEN